MVRPDTSIDRWLIHAAGNFVELFIQELPFKYPNHYKMHGCMAADNRHKIEPVM